MTPTDYTMPKPIHYVVGFAFNKYMNEVALIRKLRGPSFNIGKWNGPGGKIELGESARGAMAREFKEETSVVTKPEEWYCYHQERHLPRLEQTLMPHLNFMTLVLDDDRFYDIKSNTDERMCTFSVVDVLEFDPDQSVYNLEYLLLMARIWHRCPQHRWIEG